MKILHILSDRTARGGGQIFSLDAISALSEQDVGQFVICRPYDDFLHPLRDAEIPVEIFDFNKWNKWFQQRAVGRKILRRIKSYAPDIVHCWTPCAAAWTPAGSGVPILGWLGVFVQANAKEDIFKPYAVCDYYMGVNGDAVDHISREIGHPERVFHCHTFVSLKENPPLSRDEFGIPEGMPVILMLARMRHEKGVDILLRASADLDVFLLLVGDGGELESYRELAQKLRLESRVCFAGWRTDRAALLDIADILAVPSRFEGFPTVIPEAWSRNVPVVTSVADGMGEYIEHGVNGMLSDIEDIGGLTRNLQAVLEDANLRERLIAGGTQTYKDKFSKGVVIDSLLNAYKEIIRRGALNNYTDPMNE